MKTVIISIIILLLAAAGGIFVVTKLVKTAKPQNQALSAGITQNSPVSAPRATITLRLKKPASLIAGQTAHYDVEIETGEFGVSAVSTQLKFDPHLVKVEDVSPGSFIQNPTIPAKKIDAASGIVTYVILAPKHIVGSGTLFSLTVTPLETTQNTRLLSFIREKTDIGVQLKRINKTYSKGETQVLFAE